MARVYKHLGFTILELMVVISIIGILLAMFFAIRPDPTNYVTQSRLQRIQMAIETYHENFHVYPHTLLNGFTDNLNVLQGPFTLPEMLRRKDLRRRDGKYLDAFFDPEDDTEIELDAGGKEMFFLDGWNRRFVYYSGSHLVKAMDPNIGGNSTQMIPAWLQLTGKIDASIVVFNVAGRYRAEDYFFLGSAGKDGVFGWYVCTPTSATPGGPDDPSALDPYAGADYTIASALPTPVPVTGVEDAMDDMWNYNLGQQ